MDRLSSYASRESESEPSEDRQKNEQEAVANLLEDLRITKATKQRELEEKQKSDKQLNGEQINRDTQDESPQDAHDEQSEEQSKADGVVAPSGANGAHSPPKKHRGIPDDIKLYEIFYGQVTNLVNAQRLHIQDTIALLVSLARLAL